MTNLVKLPAFNDDGDVRVVIETPRGSRAKLDYDPKLKTFTLSKSLLAGLSYPYDWGFIPATRAEDDDPLDVMVIHEAATFPGLVLICKIIGVLQIEQHSKGKKPKRNDELFAVPRASHAEKDLSDVRDLTSAMRDELVKFFIATDRTGRQAAEGSRLEGTQGRVEDDQRFPARRVVCAQDQNPSPRRDERGDGLCAAAIRTNC